MLDVIVFDDSSMIGILVSEIEIHSPLFVRSQECYYTCLEKVLQKASSALSVWLVLQLAGWLLAGCQL